MSSPGVKVTIQPSGSAPIAGVGTSTAAFLLKTTNEKLGGKAEPVTSYDAFERHLPALKVEPDKNAAAAAYAATVYAAAAVYGFFLNGGTRCYVAYYADAAGWNAAWNAVAKLDEVALVAAPGAGEPDQTDLASRCAALGDRFAVLDGPAGAHTFKRAGVALTPDSTDVALPHNSDHAAYYYPWIQVKNPLDGAQKLFVPPSGHVAGVYARVDATRGVHKAPANEELRGALGVEVGLSEDARSTLNELGVNAIRVMQGSVRIWGARTLGGDANGDTKHVNVRRTLLFLRESIDEGLQWVVFEPNTPALWARVRRNVGAFLHDVWATGALFGNTAEEAYYVACDEELNPPSVRDNGQLNVEVGVALVKPAEFITINIRQWSGPAK